MTPWSAEMDGKAVYEAIAAEIISVTFAFPIHKECRNKFDILPSRLVVLSVKRP